MREILFRGKTDKGEWVQGVPFFEEERCYIIEDLFICDEYDCTGAVNTMVIPETVGQYTGIEVPSGKIFEHDIVTAKFKSNGARFNFTVKYSNEKGCYVFDNGHVKVPRWHIRSANIIGNIHDNPELLKGGEG